MELKPVHVLRLLMQDHSILMQLTSLYQKSYTPDKEIEQSIINLCDRVDWMVNFLREKEGFTYEDITTEPDKLPSILTLIETVSASTRAVIQSK